MFDFCLGSKLHGKEFTTRRSRIYLLQHDEGRRGKNKSLIVVSVVNSMGRSLLLDGSRKQVFQEGLERKRGIWVGFWGEEAITPLTECP
jgi:hypothetical protein